MSEPGALTPSLASSGSAALGWTRGKESVGCSHPGCAVVEGADLALLHSAPPLWLGLAGCCGIPRGGAGPLPQAIISQREILIWDPASVLRLVFWFVRGISCQAQITEEL